MRAHARGLSSIVPVSHIHYADFILTMHDAYCHQLLFVCMLVEPLFRIGAPSMMETACQWRHVVCQGQWCRIYGATPDATVATSPEFAIQKEASLSMLFIETKDVF